MLHLFQLYMFDKDTSTWVERGRGQLRLNDLRKVSESGTSVTSRIIMRTAGSLRVILNSKIFPEMTLEKPTEKNIRLTAMDEVVSILVRVLLLEDWYLLNSKFSKAYSSL